MDNVESLLTKYPSLALAMLDIRNSVDFSEIDIGKIFIQQTSRIYRIFSHPSCLKEIYCNNTLYKQNKDPSYLIRAEEKIKMGVNAFRLLLILPTVCTIFYKEIIFLFSKLASISLKKGV